MNSAWQLSLTLHIGAFEKASAAGGGIMWHMAKPSRVRFASMDPSAAVIPWVRVQRADGSATTYVARDTPLTRSALDQLPQRDLNCTDCHNRTGHDLARIDSALDRALFNGEIAASLPSVKQRISQALADGYRSNSDVISTLQSDLRRDTQLQDPALAQLRRSEADRAVAFSARLHATTVFPSLHVHWGTYPTELGHHFARGCFRCHDGEHVDSTGKAIPNDCNSTCHTPPRMGPIDSSRVGGESESDSWHPWQLPVVDPRIVDHDRLTCSDCHKDGLVPKYACEDCHHPPSLE
jgi:formate-dependent nitrite reductase cytochrome c552 subunit